MVVDADGVRYNRQVSAQRFSDLILAHAGNDGSASRAFGRVVRLHRLVQQDRETMLTGCRCLASSATAFRKHRHGKRDLYLKQLLSSSSAVAQIIDDNRQPRPGPRSLPRFGRCQRRLLGHILLGLVRPIAAHQILIHFWATALGRRRGHRRRAAGLGIVEPEWHHKTHRFQRVGQPFEAAVAEADAENHSVRSIGL